MKRKFLVIFLISLLTLTACSPGGKADDFKYVRDDGKVYMGLADNGLTTLPKNIEQRELLLINYYFEPNSGTSLRLHESLSETFNKLLEEELAIVSFTPLMYLNSEANNYLSSRLGSYILATAEHAPNRLFEFLDLVLREEFIREQTSSNENNFLEVVESLDLDEKDLKQIRKTRKDFTSHLIKATSKYIEEKKETYPILELSYNGSTTTSKIDNFKEAEEVLIKEIYSNYMENEQALNKLEKLWPNYIEKIKEDG